MQYKSDSPLVLLCPPIQFWDAQVKAFNLAPQGGCMDAYLSGSGCPVPIVFSQDLVKVCLFHVIPCRVFSGCIFGDALSRANGLTTQIVGEVFNPDPAVFANHRGIFNDVFKFPNIPREIMGHQHRQDFRGKALDLFTAEAIEFPDEVIDQERNILFSAS